MKNKTVEELNKIIKSTKKIINYMDYEEVRESDNKYPFNKSLDEVLIDLIDYKIELEEKKEMEKMYNLIDYTYYYRQAKKEHKKLRQELEEYPSWKIQDELDPMGEDEVLIFLEKQGVYPINQTDGMAYTMLEWLDGGYYSEDKEDDDKELIHEYITYLDNYVTNIRHERKYLDYDMQPIGNMAICNTIGLSIYEIINGIEDYAIVGRNFKESEPCKLYHEEESSYFMIGEMKFYLNEFMIV